MGNATGPLALAGWAGLGWAGQGPGLRPYGTGLDRLVHSAFSFGSRRLNARSRLPFAQRLKPLPGNP